MFLGRVLCVVAGLTVLGCPAPAPPPPAGPATPPPTAAPPPTATPTPPPTSPPVAKGNADGAACRTSADCQSGMCEGLGCGDNNGRCAPRGRACTRDLRQYCGCDGKTFQGSGSCPGRRYRSLGACKASGAAANGSACRVNADCASGVCEGPGCGDSKGVCVARNRVCTRDFRQYCGCDGKTFNGSGSCPGGRFRSRGPCPR